MIEYLCKTERMFEAARFIILKQNWWRYLFQLYTLIFAGKGFYVILLALSALINDHQDNSLPYRIWIR
jgi:hypothetical protein